MAVNILYHTNTEDLMGKTLALIDFSNCYSFSVRAISSYLKGRGHKVSAIHYALKDEDMFNLISEESLEALADFCRKHDAVGISLISTHNLKVARQISSHLRQHLGHNRILWGGVPVICDPQYYLQYTDFICVGEGETVMSSFLEEDDYTKISGLGYNTADGQSVINEMSKRIDLNDAPIPFFDMENIYLARNNRITSLKEDPIPLFRLSQKGYRIFPVRGCPYSCTFCANNKLNRIFRGKGPLMRSVENSRIIEELAEAKRIIPGLKSVMFYEDDFMARNINVFQELIENYTQVINLPMTFNSTCEYLTAEKLDIMIKNKTKIADIKIGLQSASRRVNHAIFKRPFEKEWYYEKLSMLASRGVHVTLDLISDNPYETIEDKYEAFQFYKILADHVRQDSIMKSPLSNMDHKLMFYPGTKMYDMALKDGHIDDTYIEKVLLARKTTRSKWQDIDNESFILALFGLAIRKDWLGAVAQLAFSFFQIRPIYMFMYQLHIFKYLFFAAKLLKTMIKKPKCMVAKLLKKNRKPATAVETVKVIGKSKSIEEELAKLRPEEEVNEILRIN